MRLHQFRTTGLVHLCFLCKLTVVLSLPFYFVAQIRNVLDPPSIPLHVFVLNMMKCQLKWV